MAVVRSTLTPGPLARLLPMNPELQSPDDPVLKAVVRRAWGQESTPRGLRELIERDIALVSSPIENGVATLSRRRRSAFALRPARILLRRIRLMMLKRRRVSRSRCRGAGGPRVARVRR